MRACVKGCLQQAAVVFRGVKRGVARKRNASKIDVRAQFAALVAARDNVGRDAFGFLYNVCVAGDGFKMLRRVGRVVAPAAQKIAVDTFGSDKVADPVQRVFAFFADGAAFGFALAGGQFFQRGFDAGADLATVAGAATPARHFCVQHQCRAPAARGFNRGVQSGIARPDNYHIGPFKWSIGQAGHGWTIVKPIGRVFVAIYQWAVESRHSKETPMCSRLSKSSVQTPALCANVGRSYLTLVNHID